MRENKRIAYVIRLYKDDRRMIFSKAYTDYEYYIALDIIKAMIKMEVIDRFIIREVDDENIDTFLKE